MCADKSARYIIDYWEKVAPVIMELRKQGNPRSSDMIEYLYTAMKQRELQRVTPIALIPLRLDWTPHHALRKLHSTALSRAIRRVRSIPLKVRARVSGSRWP
jgi:hypothetical protein